MGIKIPSANREYLKFENTIFRVSTKSYHIVHNFFECAIGFILQIAEIWLKNLFQITVRFTSKQVH